MTTGEESDRIRCDPEELLRNLDRLHTTELGEERIRKNLGIGETDAVSCCRRLILNRDVQFRKHGKNWYVEAEGCEVTVNASAFTIITAHKTGK